MRIAQSRLSLAAEEKNEREWRSIVFSSFHFSFFIFSPVLPCKKEATTMDAPLAGSSDASSSLAAGLAAVAAPAGNGTHPRPGGSGSGGGICIDLVSPHTPRGVAFNNLVRYRAERRDLCLGGVKG
jgi:hypothetical protein